MAGLAQAYEGKMCPYCLYVIKGGARIVVCSDCNTPHHLECWQEAEECTAFGCDGHPINPEGAQPGTPPDGSGAAADLTIKQCPYCGETVRAAAIKCKHCKAVIGRPEDVRRLVAAAPTAVVQVGTPRLPGNPSFLPPGGSSASTGSAPSYDELERNNLLVRRPPEYGARFRPREFSWPAFIFGPVWYLVKGMWQKAIVLFVIGVFTYGIVSAIIAGVMGYRDYMRYYNTGQQFWW